MSEIVLADDEVVVEGDIPTSNTATFAAGCFWGVQEAFDQLPGVLETEVGYTGGSTENPTYEEVCGKKTGHAEAVKVVFDPQLVRYEDLLESFFGMHDPTQVNRQGPDVGEQYRSAIFTHTPGQEAAAVEAIRAENESGQHSKPLATIVEPMKEWWKGEEYHQKYFEKNGGGSCHI